MPISQRFATALPRPKLQAMRRSLVSEVPLDLKMHCPLASPCILVSGWAPS